MTSCCSCCCKALRERSTSCRNALQARKNSSTVLRADPVPCIWNQLQVASYASSRRTYSTCSCSSSAFAIARISRCCKRTRSSHCPGFWTTRAWSIWQQRPRVRDNSSRASSSRRRPAARTNSPSPRCGSKASANSPGYCLSICCTMKSTSVPCRSPRDILTVHACARPSMEKPSALPRGVPPLRWLPAKSVSPRRCLSLGEACKHVNPRCVSLTVP
mmetsp:Transcript_10289/g.19836  ORF Transcript_10289/g.19836 Transcript_10289/m.19836 type:complete len:217 (-) Transcript_10289:674-1324(-)